MKVLFPLAILAIAVAPLHAQRLEARLGALLSSTLVEDPGPNSVLAQRIPADFVGPVKLKLAPAPVASVGLVQELTSQTALELMGSVAVSRLRAETAEGEWDTQDVSLASLGATIRYRYHPRIFLHGGIGVTRFLSEDTGVFSEGSSFLPLLELGASTSIPAGALPIRAGVRLQTHTFGTPALRRDGANDGRVVRMLIQAGIGG
jgi:hypothetical protein